MGEGGAQKVGSVQMREGSWSALQAMVVASTLVVSLPHSGGEWGVREKIMHRAYGYIITWKVHTPDTPIHGDCIHHTCTFTANNKH